MRKTIFFKPLVIVLFALLALPVAAQPPARSVSGTIVTQSLPCGEGIGVCASGTATGDIRGSVWMVLTRFEFDPATFTASYDASITISSNRGQFFGTVTNAILVPTGPESFDVSSSIRFTDGTGFYTNRQATLTTTGFIDDTIEQQTDNYTGTMGVVPPPTPEVQALSVCVLPPPNPNSSIWQVNNPNPQVLSNTPNTKVRWDWEALDARGNVLQSGQRYDQAGQTRLNTVPAAQLRITWYLERNNQFGPALGSDVARARDNC